MFWGTVLRALAKAQQEPLAMRELFLSLDPAAVERVLLAVRRRPARLMGTSVGGCAPM